MTETRPAALGPSREMWIESPLYDSLFFVAAPILGGAYLLAALYAPYLRIVPGVFFVVGMAHYLSTFTFYLGDDNRAHYRSNVVAFFVAPVALLLAAGLMRFGSFLPILLATIYLWNVWHISLQNCGILSVYRHLGGGPRDEKKFANALILSISVAAVAAQIRGFEPFGQIVRTVPLLPRILFGVALTGVGIAAAAYVRRIVQRSRAGTPLRGPEAIFLASSVLLFHPFAWAANASDATTGVLFGHFIQYLALVWLLHRRKYAPGTGSSLQNALAFFSRNVVLLGAVMVALAFVFFMTGKIMQKYGAYGVWAWLFNALVLMHFYLDGWIWAFKRPFVRASLGPFLTRHAAATTDARLLEISAVPAQS